MARKDKKGYDQTVLPPRELNISLTEAIQTFNKGKLSAIYITPTKQAITTAVYQALKNNINNGNITCEQDINDFIDAVKSIGEEE